MPLAFLVPAFLLGLLAVVIPLVVHLRQREKREPIRFPSLMFLKMIPHRRTERRRLTNLLLMAMRIAAVALLAFAFGRPFFRRRDQTPAVVGRRPRVVVIALDRSLSMQYQGVWAIARDSALAVVRRLAPRDKVALVTFDATADIAIAPTEDRALAEATLQKATPGSAATRLAPGLRLAREILGRVRGADRELVVISDFQRTSLAGAEPVELPSGTTIRLVPVAPNDAANSRVHSVEVDQVQEGGRTRLTVAARIVSKGGATPRTVRAALVVDGREMTSKTITTVPNGVVTAAFDPVWTPARALEAAVRIEPDRLAADDTLRFALQGDPAIGVILLAPAGTPAARLLFLERAFAISRRPRFVVQTTRGASVSAADLARVRLVIALDAGGLSHRTQEALAAFVARGGGVLAVAGDRASVSGEGEPGVLLPASIGAGVERQVDQPIAIGALNRDHGSLESLKDAALGDLGAARFYRYRTLAPEPGAEVVGRLSDGKPALVASTIGAGRVVLLASALDGVWSDLPLQPLFLPLTHALAKYLVGSREARSSYAVGDVAAVPPGVVKPVLVSPEGKAAPLEDSLTAVRLTELGVYRLRAANDPEPRAFFAVNVPAEESDLAPARLDEVLLNVRSAPDSAARQALLALAPEEAEARQRIWWFTLIALTVLLGAEAWYANRLSMRQI